jgi:glycosyltransferase involved in cell wall biosynthesis
MTTSSALAPNSSDPDRGSRLRGRHAAVLLFSYFPADPRPRRSTEALVSEGVNVEVICLQKDKSEPQHETIDGVEVFRIPIKRHRDSKVKYLTQYAGFILRSFLHLAGHSFRRKYDFVHVHNMPDVLVFSALVPKALGAKIILDLHDPMPELMQTIYGLQESSLGVRLLKHLEKLSIQFADLVVTVNLACRRIFSSRSCKPDKITVVMNSPDDQVFQFRAPKVHGSNERDPAGPFSILYHGSLVPRNGFDLAVDALEIAQKRIPGARLMVCGERNAYFEEVMKSVQERGLQESVHYLGVKDLRQIVEVINSCDLGVVPNHRNSFTQINTPTRIFEYLSLGKPVIAPRTLGIEDYFGKSDLLFFEPGDSADLARQIEFAFFNQNQLAGIVERGQQIYLANSWSRQKSNLIHSISELFQD